MADYFVLSYAYFFEMFAYYAIIFAICLLRIPSEDMTSMLMLVILSLMSWKIVDLPDEGTVNGITMAIWV